LTDTRSGRSDGAIIVVERASKSYVEPPVLVLEDVSLSIRRGEFFCIVGPSGCGKSTLIKLIAGIEKPTSGTVTRPERFAMVFQSYALLPWLTVRENVAFAARMAGFQSPKIREVTDHYLRLVDLEKFTERYPRELSGGQRQRVGIARALAVEPEVLLMDEPFSALDPVMTEELHQDLLEIWGETKTTIVMVSHNFQEAVFLSDRIAVIREGRLKEVVAITLPRPRIEDDAPFAAEVHRLRGLLEGGPQVSPIPVGGLLCSGDTIGKAL
jgi:NitT/TauT family transport system ATP-binding protein